MRDNASEVYDFFISYTAADRQWAEWIAWTLESASYVTIIQAWDFRPGSNFIHEMQKATSNAERTIAVISPDYLNSEFCPSEWYGCFRKDPKGEKGNLVPVRVERCELEGLLPQIVYIDLVDLGEGAAKNALLGGVKRERAKPLEPPPYPARGGLACALPPLPSRPKPAFPPDTLVLGKGFVWIHAGQFLMGSPEHELGRLEDETLHLVTLTEGFFMHQNEVTQEEFQAVMGCNPSYFHQGDRFPVEQVSWKDAIEYCHRRTEHEHRSGILPTNLCYTLPTEAQWEYACRGGLITAYCFGDDHRQLSQCAYFNQNSEGTTHPTGEKRPNAWGLFDMCGNVWEWCLDWYGEYDESSQLDPLGPSHGSQRVARGGSWSGSSESCRSSTRFAADPAYRCSSIGFRVVAVKHSGRTVENVAMA